MSNVIFIIGPTAVGKTEVGFLLAKELGAQVISADSMLIYKEPKIITSAPSENMLKEIKHYFVKIVPVRDTYNVFDFYIKAKKKIISLYNKGKDVVVCGGTGLYIKSLLDGIFEGPAKDESLRKSLGEKALKYGKQTLYQELKEVDPEAAEKIEPADLKRIIRALEVYYSTGEPISAHKKEAVGLGEKLPIRIFGLGLEREKLYQKINKRVDFMFEQGAVEEVKSLMKCDLSYTAKKIIGFSEIKDYLQGKITLKEAKEKIKKNTRNFAKRQLTWFRKDKRIEWIDTEDLSPMQTTKKIMAEIGL